MTFILLIGVASFSYIMSQFISILLEVQAITKENEDSEKMSQWLLLLKNFNNNKPLPPEMSARFEKHFAYYWKNDKNYALIDSADRSMYGELPAKYQACIYKDFLFKDFLQMFHVYFCFEKPAYMQDNQDIIKYYEWADLSYSEFMIRFLQALEPRFYS